MILVIDYGMGNLRSVSKALESLGGKVKISSNAAELEKADKVVLPGVGAFGDAMQELEFRKLVEPLRAYVASNRPFLGICLGLQLLFPSSEESQNVKGLGIFEGQVQRFKSAELKVPHMGWNQIHFPRKHPLLKGIPDLSYFYFVHSYYAKPKDPTLVIGTTEYGNETFTSILGNETVFATQFHPEKSQKSGLAILKNFIDL